MSFLLLLAGATSDAPTPDAGVVFEALGIRVILEVSESPPLADTQVWHDLSAFIHRSAPIVVSRGRSSQFDDVRAGTLSLTLDASNGDLDPRNGASPHAGCLKVRRRCRLRIVHDDVVYPVFDGYAHGFPRAFRRPLTQGLVPFEATDVFRILNNSSPTVGLLRIEDPTYGRIGVGRVAGDTAADQLSGELIEALLDALGWPAGLRDIDAGRVEVAGNDIAGRGLAGIKDANRAEGGDLFVSAAGRVTFRNRLARYSETRSTEPQATFYPRPQQPPVPTYDEPFGIAQDETRIVNQARYTPISGVPQVAEDPNSREEYGLNEDSQNLIAVHDGDALSLAQLVVAENAEPADRFEDLRVNGHTNPEVALPAVLGRELFDRVDLEVESTWGDPPFTVPAVVQGIGLTIDTASLIATFRLGAYHSHDFFTIEDPTLGAVEGVGVIAP